MDNNCVDGFRGLENVFIVFVDNLPKEMDKVWLRQILRPFGQVVGIYIPMKRSANFNTKGFIRFLNREEAMKAVQDLNGIVIREFKLQVNIAKYVGNSKINARKRHGFSTKNSSLEDVEMFDKDEKTYEHRNFVRAGSSFADIVANRKQNHSDSIIVQSSSEGFDWLKRSVVGRLQSLRNLDSLSEAFIAEGVTNIQLRDVGGNLVLLTFASPEDMVSMLEEAGMCWLNNWFVEVKQWSPNLKMEKKRIVWLSCYGVPLNLWNAETFFSIGKNWGDCITLDDATSKRTCFSVGKVKILTDTFEAINQEIILECNGYKYPIRVVEEQVVINQFLKAVCDCKDCGLRSSKEEDYDSVLEKGEDVDVEDDKSVSNVVANKGVSNSCEENEVFMEGICDSKGEHVVEVQDDQKKDETKVFSIPEESLSITSPVSQFHKSGMEVSIPPVVENRDELSLLGERSSHEALLKLERRLKRTKRKIRKKKLISEFGMKATIDKNKNREVSSTSISS